MDFSGRKKNVVGGKRSKSPKTSARINGNKRKSAKKISAKIINSDRDLDFLGGKKEMPQKICQKHNTQKKDAKKREHTYYEHGKKISQNKSMIFCKRYKMFFTKFF